MKADWQVAEKLPDDGWNSAPLQELADHIVGVHHAFVRRVLPGLTALMLQVRTQYEANHPELTHVGELFEALASEFVIHMIKEEQVLFPMIKQLKQIRQADRRAVLGMEIPIQRMIAEHEDAEELLRVIRSLTSAFQPPVASPGFHALYQGLEEFERDFHRHIHLENNILFSRAIEIPGTDQENANIR